MTTESDSLNKKKFEKTYHAHFSSFYQIAFHFLHDEEDAKEVIQEAFIKLWEKQVYLKPEPEIRNYLFILVRNHCLNLLRDKRKSLLERGSSDYLAAQLNYKLLSVTGEDLMLSAELSEKIRLAISGLTPQCRQVFTMSRTDDLSNHEIAEKLQISVKAVEANMTRALKQLREELSEYLSEDKGKTISLPMRNFLISFL
ncbi:MAG: RNA polymerase sigma-70 factor [Mangrovibacterium sp.]|nr:RNA polymerase sigma-70 factor [Mangrovibacterium sp.]